MATLEEAVSSVDMRRFLDGQDSHSLCSTLATSLSQTGAVLVYDPRVCAEDAEDFLNLLETYFSSHACKSSSDIRPEHCYQVGLTPPFTERPRSHADFVSTLSKQHLPQSSVTSPDADPKWRFFWRVGPRPTHTQFPQLNAPQVVPSALQGEWESVMNAWGDKLLNTLHDVCRMLAIGLKLPENMLTSLLQNGPHLLAPTGMDLKNVCADSRVIAGLHYDLNLLSIHGAPRFPGLHIWTRSGKRLPVCADKGWLLVQAGAQLETLTAGHIRKGMHEVAVTDEMLNHAVDKARNEGRPLWRVSSTLFGHVRSDATLKPLGHFAQSDDAGMYPPVLAGQQVADELRAIQLAT